VNNLPRVQLFMFTVCVRRFTMSLNSIYIDSKVFTAQLDQ